MRRQSTDIAVATFGTVEVSLSGGLESDLHKTSSNTTILNVQTSQTGQNFEIH